MTSNCQPSDKHVILVATIGDDMLDLFWLHLAIAFVVGSHLFTKKLA
jgi:hypothetical protein